MTDADGKFPCVSLLVDWRDILISDRGQRIDSSSEESRHLISSQHVRLIFYLDDLLAARDFLYERQLDERSNKLFRSSSH